MGESPAGKSQLFAVSPSFFAANGCPYLTGEDDLEGAVVNQAPDCGQNRVGILYCH